MLESPKPCVHDPHYYPFGGYWYCLKCGKPLK